MKKATDILLIGGGGHCASVIEVIEAEGKFSIKGIVDQKEKIGEKVLGYPIIASDEDLPKLLKQTPHVLITTGMVQPNKLRANLYKMALGNNGIFPVIVAPTATVSKHANVGAGTVIMHYAMVNAGASVGENCIINTKSLVEHDSSVAHHTHVSTAAVVNGNCIIGESCMIGSNATIIHGIKVGANSVVGAGAVVTKDVSFNQIVVGNPAKSMKNG